MRPTMKAKTMKFATLITLAALLNTPTLATAGDDWNGLYAGIHFGGSDADLTSGTAGLSDHSTVYGLQLGYSHSLVDNWVIGGELSYSTAEYKGLGPSKDMDTTRVKLKAGYDFGPTLVYGILGYANIDVGNANESGASYGIGVGFKATDNIILSGELIRDSFDIKSTGVDADTTSLALGISYQF